MRRVECGSPEAKSLKEKDNIGGERDILIGRQVLDSERLFLPSN
jgi:hypothetical protein